MTTMIGIISKKLKDRGLIPVEINRLIKDVANVMSSGKYILQRFALSRIWGVWDGKVMF